MNWLERARRSQATPANCAAVREAESTEAPEPSNGSTNPAAVRQAEPVGVTESSNGSAKAEGHVSAEEVFGTLATTADPECQPCEIEGGAWEMPPPEAMDAERLRQLRKRAPIPVCLSDRWIPGPGFVAEMQRLAADGLVVIVEAPGDPAKPPPAPQPPPLTQPAPSLDTPTLDEPGSFLEGLPSAVSGAGHAAPPPAQGGLALAPQATCIAAANSAFEVQSSVAKSYSNSLPS